MRVLLFLTIFCSCVCNSYASSSDSWAWLYKKRFDQKSARRWAREPAAWFEKRSIPKFSQLVFSWNACRPNEGYYSFCARIRNAHTKTWSQWYRMAEWGAGVQRSYSKSGKDGTKYVYVRMEADPKCLADAFQIRAVPIDGADLGNIKQFSVCTANFNLFRPEKLSDELLKLPSVCVLEVPKKSQMALQHPRAGHMCSPTSWCMLTSFLTKKDIDPLAWAEKSFDAGFDTYGSWQFNVAQAADCCGGDVEFCTVRLCSFRQLYDQIARGIPAVVSVRGGLRGAPKAYDNGHVLVVVGWDSDKRHVICHDPALKSDQATLKRYDVESFIEAWERSRRLTYFANPRHVSVKTDSSDKK